MTRRPSLVTQSSIARAIRAMQKRGLQVGKVEIDGTKIVVTVDKGDQAVEGKNGGAQANPWDRVQ